MIVKKNGIAISKNSTEIATKRFGVYAKILIEIKVIYIKIKNGERSIMKCNHNNI